ncbi:MAG: FHIPEP family type III secretion protein [Acidobacteriota bacterium]|nr:FHIPEP family type III secretion protein [Acidobacteriota bacterium]
MASNLPSAFPHAFRTFRIPTDPDPLYRNNTATGRIISGLGGLGLLPGMSHVAFLLLASGAVANAFLAAPKNRHREEEKLSPELAKGNEEENPTPENFEDLHQVDMLAMEVGYGLVGLVSADDSFLKGLGKSDARRHTAAARDSGAERNSR